MADKITFDIEGLSELARALEGLGPAAGPFIRAASNKAADVVLGKAKAKVPVDTGQLRDSLRVKKATWKIYWTRT
jgi:hypothetical protein